MVETAHLLDTSGLNCPLPVLKAKKALKSLAHGEILTVIATDPASFIDFEHFCHVSGNILEEHHQDNGRFEYVIRKVSKAS